MSFHGKPMAQHLADLSGKSVTNIRMGDLSKRYAKAIKDRKRAEAEKENEFRYNAQHVEYLKSLVAKELERCAEVTDSTLPFISVFDALQIVKARKDLDMDLGLRALVGHLETAWRRDREAVITAGSYLTLKEHYTRQYPKSRVAQVFDDMHDSGYLDLPVVELMNLVAQIETQEDYDYLIRAHGLDGNKPWQRKSRQFIIAAVNPDTGFTPEQEMDAATWVAEKIKWEMAGGSDEEFRAKYPPPQREGQKNPFQDEEEEISLSPENQKFLDSILQEKDEMPEQMYGVEDFDWEDEREEGCDRKKSSVQGEYIGNFGDVNWPEHGGLLLFNGSYGPFAYSIEPFSLITGEVEEITDPKMEWLVYQVPLDPSYLDNLISEDNIESILSTTGTDAEEFKAWLSSGDPSELLLAFEAYAAYGGWEEFSDQQYWDAEDLINTFGEIDPDLKNELREQSDEELGIVGRKAQLSGNPPDDEIIEGMAKAFFASSWADRVDEIEESLSYFDIDIYEMETELGVDVPQIYAGAEIMNIMPAVPEEAYQFATNYYMDTERSNNVDLSTFIPPGEDEFFDKETFGHYLAMEIMGHGVGWSDDHEDHGLEVPHSAGMEWDLGLADPDVEKIMGYLDESNQLYEG
jgi:hypothetical protein